MIAYSLEEKEEKEKNKNAPERRGRSSLFRPDTHATASTRWPLWRPARESGELSLLPDKEINTVAYAVAVAKATGRPVEKVVFASRKHPFPKTEWMSENVYRDSLWDSLWDSLFYTCGFALAGDEERFKVCLDLLKVQEQALGLGFKKDEPQTFVALCA